MPNGVKYSTTTPSGSLRRDNVALGVNGNLGPTANTGFYSMPAPASGKYIINKVAVSGVPLFYAPQNDTELIRFARNEGATGANTGSAAAVLSWVATQANLEAANFEYENIVTNGLVCNLDAGFVGSYPTINTTWYDLSGNTNNGTLTNGPTFSSANSGSIVFDGIDDWVNLFALNSTTSFTVDFWFKNSSAGVKVITGMYNGGGADWWIGIWSTNKFTFSFGSPAKVDLYSNDTINDGIIRHASCVYDKSTNSTALYINGTLQSTGSTPSTVNQPGGNLTIGRFGDISEYYWPGNIYNDKIYTRALSSTEVLQNFNAQKGRFGL
jgi:hypothetical protein